jgi:colanic acid biosynthesis glycosyl transferase WcaI
MERFCYRRAAVVQVLSEGHRRTLLARGVPDSKLAVVRPWVDTDFIRPIGRQNEFSSEYGLNQSFVVMYAGNFGLTQGLEQLVETASHLSNEQDIRFVLVGQGSAQVALQDSFRSAGLTNAQFIPSQPRDRLPRLLASADVALVMLRKGFGMDSVPSKTYSILASGRAIVAVVDKGSDTWQLVENASCGVCVSPGDSWALANAILRLYQERRHCSQLGANGRAYALKRHSRGSAFRQYDRLLSSMSESKQISVRENWCANASTSEVAIRQKPHDDQTL